MKKPSTAPSQPPAPAAAGKTLAKRFARFRKRILRFVAVGKSSPKPPPVELPRTIDLAAAERECARALALQPADLALATQYAELADATRNAPARVSRWRRVLELGGERTPASAIAKLADGLCDEGLLAQATTVLGQGLAKHPESSLLRESLASLTYMLATSSREPAACNPVHPATAHLFRDRFEPAGQGTVAFTPGRSALRRHVPAMLDFATIIPAPRESGPPGTADVFALWGAPGDEQLLVRETASAAGRPLLCLDSGFLSSPGIEGGEAAACSIIVTPDLVYYDTTRPSHLENLLNSDAFDLSKDQLARTESCIASIVRNRLSKFNDAPRINLRPRFPADGTRRILLVDQRKGGASIHWSLGGHATFERMLEAALAMPACQILVKLHPEVIAGHARSHFRPLLPSPLPGNFVVIDYDVNPHDLFDVVDEVFVCSSQLGFEAVMAGKEVHCFAAPYYAGWGFTLDRLAIPRRSRPRTAAAVFHLYHIVHSRYFIPGKGAAEIEDLIQHLVTVRKTPVPAVSTVEPVPTPAPAPLRILMVIPSGRHGATGRYLQNLSVALVELGCEIMIIAEGDCRHLESGVKWLEMEFEGIRLASSLRREIVEFAPHFIYENGVRSRAQRAALEALVLTGARFAMQSEDDDIQVHRHRHSEEAADRLPALDRPQLTTTEVAEFLKNHDWNRSLQVLLEPRFNRWVEPLLRILCYRLASFHTAIWHPFAERLSREYAVPTLVVPPVACPADFERIPMSPQERADTLGRYDIDPAATVIFIGGALYSYSDEFAVFLTALDLASHEPGARFALVVTSDRSSLPLGRMAAEKLGLSVSFTDIGIAADAVYMEMLKACDIVCSPGLPDDFNRYRLPSRLVRAMAMAKPILTCRCGFGESLEHGHNAFLMEGEDPSSWAASIALTRDASIRSQVGERGRDFAREHFDATRVAAALKQQFELSLCQPLRTLATGITIAGNQEIRPKPSIRLRNRNSSPLQPAIHALALRTHRLDTVVHLGSGKCDELEDYCRLGARRIHLVADSPKTAAYFCEFTDMDRTITVEEAGSSSEDLGSTTPSDYGLLVIEATAPEMHSRFVSRFRWVIIHAGNPGEFVALLAGAGFQKIILPVDHGCLTPIFLFERETAVGTLATS